jgi:hypothetical protein
MTRIRKRDQFDEYRSTKAETADRVAGLKKAKNITTRINGKDFAPRYSGRYFEVQGRKENYC